MAAIPPPAPLLAAAEGALLAGPHAAGAPISTCMEYYTDVSQDEYD
jgi:hypothetical protein